MSVRHGLLALLSEGPMHCSQLRQEFEQRTGGTWPLNIGQVWTTTQRLVRDGLVEAVPDDAHGTPDSARDDVELFRLTAAGQGEAAVWWTSPVRRGAPGRDELAIKVALAVTVPGVDVTAILQTQRTESLRALREYTRLTAAPGTDLAWSLVLDSLVFAVEAEVRWLDHVEARIGRDHLGTRLAARTAAVPAPTSAGPDAQFATARIPARTDTTDAS